MSVFLLRAVVGANLLPLAIVKSATPSPASVTVGAGFLQIWYRQDPAGFECRYSLDFKVKVEDYPHSRPASDGLTVAIVPQSSSVKCYSWKRDTAQFHLVESDDRICIDWPEYSPDGRLFACWSDTGFLVRVWDTQTSQLVGKFPTFSVCAMALSPTLIQHSPGDILIALWHRFGNTIRLFDIYTGHLCASILGRTIYMAVVRDGTKLAYYAPDLGLRIWDTDGWVMNGSGQ